MFYISFESYAINRTVVSSLLIGMLPVFPHDWRLLHILLLYIPKLGVAPLREQEKAPLHPPFFRGAS